MTFTVFSSTDKSEKLKCRLLQFLFGALSFKLYRSVPVFPVTSLSYNNRLGELLS